MTRNNDFAMKATSPPRLLAGPVIRGAFLRDADLKTKLSQSNDIPADAGDIISNWIDLFSDLLVRIRLEEINLDCESGNNDEITQL